MTASERRLVAYAQEFAPQARTLPAMLIRQAERFPNRVLVRLGALEWTFAEALTRAAAMARRLAAAASSKRPSACRTLARFR
jgi:non-ribosomal peptide synthetase component F